MQQKNLCASIINSHSCLPSSVCLDGIENIILSTMRYKVFSKYIILQKLNSEHSYRDLCFVEKVHHRNWIIILINLSILSGTTRNSFPTFSFNFLPISALFQMFCSTELHDFKSFGLYSVHTFLSFVCVWGGLILSVFLYLFFFGMYLSCWVPKHPYAWVLSYF